MARELRVRDCDRPFLGLAGTYTHDDLYKISGKYIACPGCTRDDYDLGNCHLTPILEEWGEIFVGSWQFPEPELVPPTWQSIATRNEAHLNLVLNERQAIMGGCGSFRACPHKRLWKFSLLETRFGNPAKFHRRVAGAEKRLAIKERKLEKAMLSGDAAKIEAAKKEAATKARSLKIAVQKSKARPGCSL